VGRRKGGRREQSKREGSRNELTHHHVVPFGSALKKPSLGGAYTKGRIASTSAQVHSFRRKANPMKQPWKKAGIEPALRDVFVDPIVKSLMRRPYHPKGCALGQ